jgi:hypothetical protein
MSLLLSLLALQAGASPADQLIERARAATSVRANCAPAPRSGEVVVCARRRADRYRLPFQSTAAGTRADPTPDQRLAATKLDPLRECGYTPFIANCPKLGAGVTVGSDGRSRVFTERVRTADIAP